METSLARLQKQNNLLNEKLVAYKDQIDILKEQNSNLKAEIRDYKKNMEIKIDEALTKALSKFESDEIKKLKEENVSLKERIFKLEQRLNISSDTSSLPPSQDPIWHKDTKIYDSRSQKDSTNTIVMTSLYNDKLKKKFLINKRSFFFFTLHYIFFSQSSNCFFSSSE